MKCDNCGNEIRDDSHAIHLFCDCQPRRLLDLAAELIGVAHEMAHVLRLINDDDQEELRVARLHVESVRGHLTMRINREAEG